MNVLRLKELLKEKKTTGKQLAEMVGVTANTISFIITGKSYPSFDLLIKIANALQVDIKDLFNSTKDNQEGKIYLIKDDNLIILNGLGDLTAYVIAKREDLSEVLIKHSNLTREKVEQCKERFKE